MCYKVNVYNSHGQGHYYTCYSNEIIIVIIIVQIQCHDIVEEWQFSLVWVPVGFWLPSDGGLVRGSGFDDEGGALLEEGVGEGEGLQSHHRKKGGGGPPVLEM